MVDSVIGYVTVAGAVIGLIWVIYKRSLGSRHFGDWQGGGKVSFAGQIAIWIFVGSIGGMFLNHSAIWCIPALCAWLVGFFSQHRANRQHQSEEEELRKKNSLNHPGIFDNPPPNDIDSVPDEQLDLYDAGACTFLGEIAKSDIKAVLTAFAGMPDLKEPNDIFVIQESMELIPKNQITQEFATMLNDAFTKRDYLVLRWMPQSQNIK